MKIINLDLLQKGKFRLNLYIKILRFEEKLKLYKEKAKKYDEDEKKNALENKEVN